MAISTAQAIQSLIDYAVSTDLIGWDDRIWSYNFVLDLIGAENIAPDEGWAHAEAPSIDKFVDEITDEQQAFAGAGVAASEFDLEGILGLLAEKAIGREKEENTLSGRDRISMRIMGTLMPKPSEVSYTFKALHAEESPKVATDYFYQLSCNAGYVRRQAIARNIQWSASTTWGDLEITINLSKPEKDPREIAAAGAEPSLGKKYPACQLCIENEGYAGRSASSPLGAHPARQNLRIIPLELAGERWGFQYSPYAYFNEHCITMSAHHRPMHIDRSALTCLFDFVDYLPHYFIGSNADLPIVGGSILSHDHFQGGAHEFPMMKAAVSETFALPSYPDVQGAVLTWPLSVIRLTSSNREALLEAACHVIAVWKTYSDESVGVVARSKDGTPHNTVTPVVRRVNDVYEAYLALRCNITSDEHPLGVFHPHAEYHHIKKENIGLIEVMGLAILPPRLVPELDAVGKALVDAAVCSNEAALEAQLLEKPKTLSHAAWALEVFRRHRAAIAQNSADIESLLHDEVGAVFAHVLEDAGVFKWDSAGRQGQRRFLDAL